MHVTGGGSAGTSLLRRRVLGVPCQWRCSVSLLATVCVMPRRLIARLGSALPPTHTDLRQYSDRRPHYPSSDALSKLRMRGAVVAGANELRMQPCQASIPACQK